MASAYVMLSKPNQAHRSPGITSDHRDLACNNEKSKGRKAIFASTLTLARDDTLGLSHSRPGPVTHGRDIWPCSTPSRPLFFAVGARRLSSPHLSSHQAGLGHHSCARGLPRLRCAGALLLQRASNLTRLSCLVFRLRLVPFSFPLPPIP